MARFAADVHQLGRRRAHCRRRAAAAAALTTAIEAVAAAPTDANVVALETARASSAALPAVLADLSEKRAAAGECRGD